MEGAIPAVLTDVPVPTAICCECGTSIEPNPAHMCVGCLRSRVDLTEGIPKQATILFCRGCERYLQPPGDWVQCTLESKELLSLCIKKLKGLNRVKLIDACFLWTEPHSKRIKVKLTVHGSVFGGAVLQQVFVVEYVVSHHMCDQCHRTEAQDFWRASVQIRQRDANKKTLFYLEQMILKYKAHQNTIGMENSVDGLDFFFTGEAPARKMVDFLVKSVPCRYQHSKKQISHDIRSNVYNYKFTYSIEIVPVSKNCVVCLPKKLTQQLGGLSPICLVYRVTNTIHIIDPSTAQIAEVSSQIYWRSPFKSICNPSFMTEYIVMDIEQIQDKDRKTFPGQGTVSYRHCVSDVYVVKASELGLTENTIHVRSHLGHVLKTGDSVLGYNLGDSNINDVNYDQLSKDKIPDVILVKKYYDRSIRKRQRNWKLKHLSEENAAMNVDSNEYREFLDDLEEDPTLRQNVNVFKDMSKQIRVDENDKFDSDMPQITLEEMLDDLVIDDVDMAEEY